MICDVHIITLENERKDWLQQCLSSLETEPVDIHIIQGTKGHIGKGRAAGFAAGDSPFVSFVDPDDYVHPGAFQRALLHLYEHPEVSVVCSAERVVDENDNFIQDNTFLKNEKDKKHFFAHVHHLVVARRACIEPYLKFVADIPQRAEFCLWAEMANDGHKFGYVDSVDYTWRAREGSARTAIKSRTEDIERFADILNKLTE